MSLRVISGRAGVGKTTFIHHEIVEDLKQHPFGPPIYILVPDQMSFTTEYTLTNQYDVKGIMRAQVLPFKRLAWFILQQTGGIAKDRIDSFGYRMMLRRILEEHKEELTLFRQAAGKRGFTQEVEQLLREFSQYDITSETIGPIIAEMEGNERVSRTLISKLKDLQIIIRELEDRIGDSYIDGEGFYPILVEQLRNAKNIQDAHIYLDGFVRFTKREFAIVQQLLAVAKRVTVVLPFEEAGDAAIPENLYHQAAVTYDKLVQEALDNGIEIEPRVHLTEQHRFTNEDLAHVELQFHAPEPVGQEAQGFVQILEGANRRAEVMGIAREILRLVQEEGVRYRDVGIMYRQPDVYDALIGNLFKQHDIPFFSNEKRPMLHHPLIELTRSALEAIQSNWQYEPVFRGVKTDLFSPIASYEGDLATVESQMNEQRERIDELENFVIARGIQQYRWHDERYWVYKRYKTIEKLNVVQTSAELEKQEQIQQTRDIIRTPLRHLEQRIKKATTGLDMAKAIYGFVEELQVYEKLQLLKSHELEDHAYTFASEHDQAWNQWVNVLDQFVLMFGEQHVTLEETIQILEEGYDALQFTGIPPTVDEVTVSQLDFARFDNMKVVFIIGFNDGVYPIRIEKEGILSDAERLSFEESQIELAPNSKSKLLQEAFLIYRGMSFPSERLYITYASADEEGKGLIPSLYVNRLHKLFEVEGKQTLPHIRLYVDPIEELDETRVLSYLRHPSPSIAYLTMQLKHAELTGELADEWVALQAFYEQDEQWQAILQHVMKPLYKKNIAETLTEEHTQALYGEELQASVSRIERFYRCAFAHFTSYGLQLQDRMEYKLETFAMGDLFHEALRAILASPEAPPTSYAQCLHRARETVDPLVSVFSANILESSSRYVYIKEKLIRVVARTLYALMEHAKVSHFKPVAYEKPFGKRDGKTTEEKEMSPLPALEIELEQRRKMYLAGQIDRIDVLEKEEALYLRVLDYKSSSREIDLNEVYYGLSLQLLTYLDVALKNAHGLLPDLSKDIVVVPAGMLYVHVHDPLISLNEVVEEQVRELARLEKYKMNGLLTSDLEVLQEMDAELAEGSNSIVIPAGVTKKGELTAASKTIDESAMPAIRQFVREKHRQAGNEIFQGKTSIAPFKLKDRTACDYCQFKAVCQFDPTDGQQAYKTLNKQSPKAVIEKIKEEAGYANTDETE